MTWSTLTSPWAVITSLLPSLESRAPAMFQFLECAELQSAPGPLRFLLSYSTVGTAELSGPQPENSKAGDWNNWGSLGIFFSLYVVSPWDSPQHSSKHVDGLPICQLGDPKARVSRERARRMPSHLL